MYEYRRLTAAEPWHWCTHCAHWPTDNFEMLHDKPDGPWCENCQTLESANQCEPITEPQPRPLGPR